MREYFIWLFKLVTLVVMFFVVVPLVIGLVGMAFSHGGKDMVGPVNKTVAVLELEGPIDDSKELLQQLHRQAQDDSVKGIVLRINSPGGAVAPSQEIYRAVRELKGKKPIVASMGSLAASGGLYSALGASKIYCLPGTLTGSIGVILQVPNFSRIADWAGFQMITVKSGALKDAGNPFREFTPEDRALLEQTVHEVYLDFVKAVVEGRGISESEVLKFADGRVIVGSDAKRLNLVDEFGDVYDAARAVFEIRGEPLKEGETPRLVYPEDRFGTLKELVASTRSFIGSFRTHVSIRYQM